MFSGGEKGVWAAVGCAFCRHWRFWYKIELHTIKSEESIFMALIAVSYNLDFSGLCATRRLFKLRGCHERKIHFIR